MVVDFWMLSVLVVDISLFGLSYHSSACRTFFVDWHLEFDLASELIFLDFARHKPVTVQALEVKLVEALIHADQVRAVGELFNRFMLFISEVFQAYGTSTSKGVIVLGEDISDTLMSIIEQAGFIWVFSSGFCKSLELFFNPPVNLIDLIIIEALANLELKLRRNVRVL